MSLMYSLQIFVKLVPFITAHNSDIYSHIEVYSHSFKLFNGHHPWPEQEESNTGCLLSLVQRLLVPFNDASFYCYHPHMNQASIWQYSHKYARQWSIQHDKQKPHAHRRHSLGGFKTRNTVVWVEQWYSCASSVYSPPPPKRRATFSQLCRSIAKHHCGPWLKKNKNKLILCCNAQY